ncbi:hypothetical protein ACWN8V_13670 [Vagococcus elongatus]|uniref:Mga helix-turn-helix domain-containing protein n=1 Tax=Vagococcus elongatus TaxID=180344 RepID=A0A430AHL8_9ENTE|nr:hypothetical protein [Vagococcus elongatus]RSU07592.1 hypothetical protein CBF29_13545 [Vagococcus elongatus]
MTRYQQGFLTDSKEWDDLSEENSHIVMGDHGELEAIVNEMGLEMNEALVKDLVCSIYFLKEDHIPQVSQRVMNEQMDLFIQRFQKSLFLEMDINSQKLAKKILMLIFMHHQAYPFKDPIIFDKFRFNAVAISKNYPNYARLLEYSLKIMEKETNFPWYSIYFTDILYWIMVKWQNLPIILENKRTKVTVLVLTDHGSDHTIMLASLLEKNFGQKAHVKPYTKPILNLQSLTEESFADCDLFVTNFICDTLPKHKMVVVNTFPTDQDWGKIRVAINERNRGPENIVTNIDDLFLNLERQEIS